MRKSLTQRKTVAKKSDSAQYISLLKISPFLVPHGASASRVRISFDAFVVVFVYAILMIGHRCS